MKFHVQMPENVPLSLQPEQATDLFRRLLMAVAEVQENDDLFPDPTTIKVDVILDEDGFPDGDLAQKDYVAIPYSPLPHPSSIWVWVEDYYVTKDGEVLFE